MRRRVTVVAVAALVLSGCSGPSPTGSPVTLTVVGTSDVFDAHLVQDVIKPGFEKAHPGIRLAYVSKGTGAAIAYAEAGTAGALLVHAASLENRFVAAGYSAERYGRAVFYGEFVLAGPSSDPAGVLDGAPHDIVGAFRRIAAAGTSGRASFVSRGGTAGTTVQEHAIWARAATSARCAVSKADGGGAVPTTHAGDCSPAATPDWYHTTGLTQGPNVVNADACNYAVRGCYVLSDRGTFDYLSSTRALSGLKVVTSGNATSAPGGTALLVNSFHAYAVNPARFAPDVAARLHPAAARAFLEWLTSPPAQRAVGGYLAEEGSPPFRPAAAPVLTVTPLPQRARSGEALTVSGTLRNPVPGTPVLEGETVSVLVRRPGQAPAVVATATTDAHGRFATTVTATATASWSVSTKAIGKVEKATLDPVFGDLLAPATAGLGTVAVG